MLVKKILQVADEWTPTRESVWTDAAKFPWSRPCRYEVSRTMELFNKWLRGSVAGPEGRESLEGGRKKVRKWLSGFFVFLPPFPFSFSVSRISWRNLIPPEGRQSGACTMTYPYTLIIRGGNYLPLRFGLIFLAPPHSPLRPRCLHSSPFSFLYLNLFPSPFLRRCTRLFARRPISLVPSFTSHRDLDSVRTLKWERVVSTTRM